MPELPEVETIVQDLKKKILGETFETVKILDARVIRGLSSRSFAQKIQTQRIHDIQRRGKAIIMTLAPSQKFFVVQVMMTGQLVVRSIPDSLPATKIIFRLFNQKYLHYNDQRLFGRLQVVDQLEELKYFRVLGPEPFSRAFNPEQIKSTIKKRKMPIKPLLMDHTFVAGVGNIYASEILFAAGIHPQRSADSLDDQEIIKLRDLTRMVLKKAIAGRGTSMRDYRDSNGEKGNFKEQIQVYGREDERCPRDQSLIQRIVLRGRSTFFCKACQQ